MTRYVLTENVGIEVPGAVPMPGYLARPDDDTPSRGSVIIGMELFGVSAHVRDVCDRLAGHGYTAVAPDFYHRAEPIGAAPGVELPADADGRQRGFQLLNQLTRRGVVDDVAATVDWLEATGQARLVGMIGLSVGGHFAYLAATRLPLPAVAIFYAGWLTTTEISVSRPTPTLADTSGITGRVQMFLGGADPLIPAEQRARITRALIDAGVEHDVHVYPGVGHGFLCDRRPSFHPEAADDAWNRLLHFLSPVHHRSTVR
ncbi:MAG TPA: dienelactone hydrolase family protein [Jatrophihabitantaceae bacterium]|jgi:carboxymethylenebutenolidase